MKKKWIVIPALLVPAVAGVLAATPPERDMPAQHLGPKVVVDRALRQQTIDALVAKLNDHYVFPDKAKAAAAALRQRQSEGKYDAITDGGQLARQLTEDIERVAHDKHLQVGFEPDQVPPDPVGPPPQSLADFERIVPLAVRQQIGASNLGVEKVDHLSPNIGYLALSQFPPHFLMAGKYAAAMDRLADTDGLIVDLRGNGGGFPETVVLLASYFVDQRTRLNDMWDRTTNVTKQHWTLDKLDGKRYGGKKPVVILTGPGTMSAGEDFAYTMQAMKRATVIGERTWGGAHPARPYRLGEHFFAVIPDARPINPVTHADWEGTGVTPDIQAPPDKALAAAKDLLQRRLREAAPAVTAQR